MEQKINFNQSEKYKLLFRVHSPNEASFYVFSEESACEGGYMMLDLPSSPLYVDNLKDAIFSHAQLSLNYESVQILVINNIYTFVPQSIYEENKEHQDAFLYFNFEDDKNKVVLRNSITSCKIENIFGIPKQLYDFLQRTFPGAEYIHHVTPLLQYFLKQPTIGENGRIFVHMTNDDISVFCFRSNRVEAVNTFFCTDVNDAAYYILSLWDKLKFNQQNDGLHIAGLSDKKADLITVLSRFIENVTPVSNPVAGDNKLILPFDIQAYLHVLPQLENA